MEEILEQVKRADKLLAMIPVSGDGAVVLVEARRLLKIAYDALEDGAETGKREEE